MQEVFENDKSDLDDNLCELFKDLTKINQAANNFTAEEYINFENQISNFHPPIIQR